MSLISAASLRRRPCKVGCPSRSIPRELDPETAGSCGVLDERCCWCEALSPAPDPVQFMAGTYRAGGGGLVVKAALTPVVRVELGL